MDSSQKERKNRPKCGFPIEKCVAVSKEQYNNNVYSYLIPDYCWIFLGKS